ncbi:tRNA 5-methoxyuridine(34)/uridine 5-oxyacetic acid(34) synthase CmoB [Alteromonas sp. 5E99-2]|uniref:tRNA 5-methoxyuridine(34)/uridine 5-oxyacetic acid(34) synthase CmoB n=1 Tax=Alteromonas sp. 5E99-2 TaxID=2817683 RepID=UPI001A9A0BF6|nr:tRNA 5-methoxyuridine(34)/uridine 5-oxyacetic acid(34) synthase CmoB [Alteromonas sp. 5E99-2]MBO1255552.1 tRNA 5-methoxyuridine(34)/uridine 5-oxyacetic acid(34) synthase CmoB [Alteromonas sp. 5E99-2]
MKWFSDCYKELIGTELEPWLETLPAQLSQWEKDKKHGDFAKWVKLLSKLPQTQPSTVDLKDSVTAGTAADIEAYTQKQIEGLLRQFMPWRKGPFSIHGIHIDTEWRSDWKWDRLSEHIASLENKTVLDIGCGSGYHMWRMLGAGAKTVVGIDPTQLFLIQFQAIKHFIQDKPIHLLPVGIEDMPKLNAFDTVFTMGVLYHRKDALTFLTQVFNQLKPGGELVLETLVVDGDENTVLLASDRYAQMRNVWFFPSTKALLFWLERLGFVNCRCVDESITSIEEQRATSWMDTQSLVDFLDPEDHSKTIEGYPAPKRAVIIANKKG